MVFLLCFLINVPPFSTFLTILNFLTTMPLPNDLDITSPQQKKRPLLPARLICCSRWLGLSSWKMQSKAAVLPQQWANKGVSHCEFSVLFHFIFHHFNSSPGGLAHQSPAKNTRRGHHWTPWSWVKKKVGNGACLQLSIFTTPPPHIWKCIIFH